MSKFSVPYVIPFGVGALSGIFFYYIGEASDAIVLKHGKRFRADNLIR